MTASLADRSGKSAAFRAGRDNGTVNDHASAQDAPAALVALPKDLADDLLGGGLAGRVPVFRDAVLDAVIVVGTDAGTVVTLMQAPDTVRRFAGWLREHAARHEDSITVQARRGGRSLTLRVDGSVPIETISDFIADALADDDVRPG
jgi:hypothetical protein